MKSMKRVIFTFVLTFVITIGISFQYPLDNQVQKIFGNWEFQYLLLNGKSKIWVLNEDTINFDYMNIYFIEKDTFDIQGTLVMKTGRFTIDKDTIYFNTENSIDDIIPKDNSSDYKRNIEWTRDFFNKKCLYKLENDSTLKLYKQQDSVLVFRRF